MKTVFHGPLPANIRDHGVFSEPAAVAVAAPPAVPLTKIEELTAKRDDLSAQVDALVERVKAGSTDAAEITALATLSGELKQATEELAAAEQEAKDEAAATERKRATERRARFEQLLVTAAEKRTTFEESFKQTCLAFGEFCESCDELTALANALVTYAGPLPLDRNRLAEVAACPDPLRKLLDAYTPTTGFGWNLSFAIAPLKRRF